MSNRYKGGVISATPPTTTGGESGTASGAWTLEQQMQAQGAGNWPIQPLPKYIEDVFSTWLYTGNGSTQTITNGIDLSGKGGLTWIKQRTLTRNHNLFDTARGATKSLFSDSTSLQVTGTTTLTSFNANGFSLGTDADTFGVNLSAQIYSSWTFRKQPKFFDVVTWSGNSVSGRQIPHSLGSVPGCIIVKVTSVSGSWFVWHRSMGGNNFYMTLNSPDPRTNGGAPYWNNTGPTDTVFTVGNDSDINQTGRTYVAYLFAHDAGGFGLTGTDNVISCGSYTGNGSNSGPVINLGYEPQWVLVKNASGTSDWRIYDSMRGFVVQPAASGGGKALYPNLSTAETDDQRLSPSSTGFDVISSGTSVNASGSTYIYIAIRRGPMKVPTDGTSVLVLSARTGTGANATVTGSAGVTDLAIIKNRGVTTNWVWVPRLTGTGYMSSNSTNAEAAAGTTILQANPWDVMDGVKVGTTASETNASSNTFINYLIDRAPGFMDAVCYTGTGAATRTLNHNLGVSPELVIIKARSNTANWTVWNSKTANGVMILNGIDALDTSASEVGNPTSTTFDVKVNGSSTYDSNWSGYTYVAYLFASCPGVSKVGSYTGTGAAQTIDCGFASGARFVLIKGGTRAGGWYVWDSARGIVSGNDPHLRLNVGNPETTTDDWIDPVASGFEISSTASAVINEAGFTFIYLAIA